MEAVILAGGLGTRLRSMVPDLPKPMAPVGGKPFLAWVLEDLRRQGIRRAVLAVGYRWESIRDYFGAAHAGLALDYSVEADPLGTGGAIRQALDMSSAEHVFVVNGDTYLELDYAAMMQAHLAMGVPLTLSACALDDVGRYGALEIRDGRVTGFLEKGRQGPGRINGGVYVMQRGLFGGTNMPEKFSFETDFLMQRIGDLAPLAYPVESAFIDIGVPEDYVRAAAIVCRSGDA